MSPFARRENRPFPAISPYWIFDYHLKTQNAKAQEMIDDTACCAVAMRNRRTTEELPGTESPGSVIFQASQRFY